jgi:hypothetical protein
MRFGTLLIGERWKKELTFREAGEYYDELRKLYEWIGT